MGRPKGLGKVPGSGRKKGSANVTTTAIKEMIQQALHEVGGINYLKAQALENPSAFMTLIGKIIPAEVRNEVTGKDGGALQFHRIELVAGNLQQKLIEDSSD